jgi:hypothetical protein
VHNIVHETYCAEKYLVTRTYELHVLGIKGELEFTYLKLKPCFTFHIYRGYLSKLRLGIRYKVRMTGSSQKHLIYMDCFES